MNCLIYYVCILNGNKTVKGALPQKNQLRNQSISE